MITLNKSMIILPHEEMIEKLENTRIKRMNLFGNLNQYMGSDSTNSNFTKDENRKPILILKELEQTAIHTPTQESYDTLMQFYEIQKPEITPKMIQEISQWFETNKPNRKSKRCILDLL